MRVNNTLQSALSSSLALGAGLTSLVAVLAYRVGVIERRRHRSGARWRSSKRSAELTRGGTPAHILEHIAGLGDPDYICLSIAENKLTVGPLLDKLREFSVTAAQFRGDGEPPRRRRASITTAITSDNNRGLNVAGDSSDVDSAGEGAALGAVATATTPSARPVDISPADISTAGAVVASPMVMGEPAHSTISSTSTAVAPSSHRLASMGYGEVRGPLWVRREIAEMMGRRMFHRDDVDPDNVVIAAGATSVLRLLVVALTEEGEGCLIPGPYFPGFDKVLNIAGVRAWVANRDPAEGGGGVEGGVDDGISPRVLETALRRARSSGVEIRVLLITSPHNPTGRMYSPKALLSAVSWGRRRGLQIVVDEVYANCIHRPNASFRSVGGLLMVDGAAGMGGDVHVLYGLSKDLGVAGWRVGVLYSENKEVVGMVSKMAHASQASSDTMDLVGRLFREPSFLDDYFTQHQEGLRLAYMSLVNQLGRKGIMYQQAEAGLFVMLDLREYLEVPSKEAEERLWRQMLERTKVNLTPGGAFHCVEPGWFRLCFAYQQVDVVSRAVDRIADFLEALATERAAAARKLEKQAQLRLLLEQEQRRVHPQRRRVLGSASTACVEAFSSAVAFLSAAVAGVSHASTGDSAEREEGGTRVSDYRGPGSAAKGDRGRQGGPAGARAAVAAPGGLVGTASPESEASESSHARRPSVVDILPW